MALYQLRKGETDAEQFSERMELLRRNPDLESKPANEMSETVKEFIKLSNQTEEDCDDDFPFPFESDNHDGPYSESEDASSEDSDSEISDNDDSSQEDLAESGQDKSDRVCLQKVIQQEKGRFQ